MEKAILPNEKAHEPNEGARNPMLGSMSPQQGHLSSQRLITFATDTDLSEKHASSQKSYKEVLSQPTLDLSHRQKLLWLQSRRTSGLWVQCDDCDRWRFLSNVLDRHELPDKWYCTMNPDSKNADCSVPEAPIRLREEEDLIHSAFAAGSVVWARMPGWPWWPAMVDDCPDTEQYYWLDGFSDIPTHYNVVFFDTEVTRGWIAPGNLKPYIANKDAFKNVLQIKKYKNRLESAMTQAGDASKLSLVERLRKYSFIAKYKGNVDTPKKVTKKDLIRQQKKMKRRFNIEFPIEVSSDDDTESLQQKSMKKRNMMILGTPQKEKSKRAQTSNIVSTPVTTPKQNKTAAKIDTTALLTKRGKPKKRFHDSMNVCDTTAVDSSKVETGTGPSSNEFKQQSSLAVQLGSVIDTVATETESYDNDTSKTYVPELRKPLESLDNNNTEMGTQEFELQIATPSSDDFDF